MAGLDKFLYNFARRYATPMIKYTGLSKTISSVGITCLATNNENDVVLASGTTVPVVATDGYAKGCLFFKTDDTFGYGGLYQNVGSKTSCAFAKINPVPWVDQRCTPTDCATNTTLTAATCAGLIVTNTGSAGTIVLTLPAVATMAGKALRIQVTVAQIVRASLTGVGVYLAGSGVVTKYLNIAGVIGNYAVLYCDGAHYHVVDYSGVLTKEA
jgi:hypothetical protein